MIGLQNATAAAAATQFINNRRRFMSRLGLIGAAVGVGTVGLATSGTSAALTTSFKPVGGSRKTVVDSDILNFALNFEYLGAEYYQIAAYGTRLPSTLTTGGGTAGTVTGGRQVPAFASAPDSPTAQFARELARDEYGHVEAVRSLVGRKAVAEPDIDIGPAFTAAAIAAGVITAGQTFDPYANATNFLIGAFMLEDVCVTALIGGSVYIKNETVLAAAGGLLGTEGYQAGAIRTMLFGLGQSDPMILTNVQKISDLRDSADGPGDKDQGLTDKNGEANIIPTDGNGLAFGRSFQEVLNIAYLGNPTGGGFFPNRVNGRIR